ncbi:cation:proton antiporter domain-containing protein [Pseudothauera rhizosphaerae]|uniref:RCK N-terminal domain-containing protein n=1 Tax=Pseudothauera rhizosphaerae TaxID=2565932 RepID=A0A4S4AEX0_9RHOO|nr:cation:proton antiporter [Pseudothauera rhizosphaerae]THF57709.1 hypothetical protein E6O51_17940 [Pseudothauera rhizosphaerae]
MEHNISLITTIAAGFGLALILGFVAERLRLPALVGYLLAGIVIGWLVVEDLATVLVLVPPLAGVLGSPVAGGGEPAPLWQTIGLTLLQVAGFIAVMLLVGRRILPWLLWQVARTGSRELFTLSVVAAAISIAYGAATLFSVSFALGAFFAGMVMRESEFSHRAADPAVLVQAHVANAAMLVVATPDPLNVRQMADIARTLNPGIEIVLRTHSEEESRLLRKEGLDTVFFGEEELARGMTGHVLQRFGV